MAINTQLNPNTYSGVKNNAAWWGSTSGAYTELQLYVEDDHLSGTYTALGKPIREYPDENGYVIYDVARLLAGKVSHPTPDLFDYFYAAPCNEATVRYYLDIREYDSNNVETGFLTTSPYWAVLGGLPRQEFQSVSAGIETGNFLTRQPSRKKTSAVAPEFLEFIFTNNITDVDMQVDVILEDLSTDSYIQSFPVSQYDRRCIPVGYKVLDLETRFAQPVIEWTISLYAQGGSKISNSQTYVLDCHCSPLERYFLFLNTLGGIDTLRTVGESKHSFSVAGEQAERIVSPFENPNLHQKFNYNQRGTDQIEQYTGFQNQASMEWLRDLLLSEKVWRIGGLSPNPTVSGYLQPIRLKLGEFDFGQDNVFTQGLKFDYEEFFI